MICGGFSLIGQKAIPFFPKEIKESEESLNLLLKRPRVNLKTDLLTCEPDCKELRSEQNLKA